MDSQLRYSLLRRRLDMMGKQITVLVPSLLVLNMLGPC
jgi:hypothetical protein